MESTIGMAQNLQSFNIKYFFIYIIYSYFTNSHYSCMVRIKEKYQPLTSRKLEILLYLTNIKLPKRLDLWVL